VNNVEPKGRTRLLRTALLLLVIACLVWLFGFRGNAQEADRQGTSAILWMVRRWRATDENLTLGWIIPLVSLFALWQKRNDLRAAPASVYGGGLVVVVLSLLLHWVGLRSQLTRLSLLALIGLLWGIPSYLWGRSVARILVFPCAYLLFCIPLSFLNNLTVPLRILASSVSVGLLNGLGISAVRQGTAVFSSAGGGFNFDVADACSGLRSLLAMAAVTAAYAHFTQRTLVRKWILFLATVPLALIGNVARIVTVGVVAATCSRDAALGVYHTFSGFIIFAVAILLMMAVGSVLNLPLTERLAAWRSPVSGPTSRS